MNLHHYQKKILKTLMYSKNRKYMQMKPEEISSKHFNYHLQQLVQKNIIRKENNMYGLTTKGKQLVGKMSDDASNIEELPKVTVWIYVQRKKGKKIEYLATKRTKQPYYGKIGWVCGKCLFGETFVEAAQRELFEETGLTADFSLNHMYHKIRHNTKGDVVQDTLFIVFVAKNPQGDLKPSAEGTLFWICKSKLLQHENLFDDVKENLEVMEKQSFCLVETTKQIEDDF